VLKTSIKLSAKREKGKRRWLTYVVMTVTTQRQFSMQ